MDKLNTYLKYLCEGLGHATRHPHLINYCSALMRIHAACELDETLGVVFADAGYGNNTAYRDGLDALGLKYMVGVNPSTSIWAPGGKGFTAGGAPIMAVCA